MPALYLCGVIGALLLVDAIALTCYTLVCVPGVAEYACLAPCDVKRLLFASCSCRLLARILTKVMPEPRIPHGAFFYLSGARCMCRKYYDNRHLRIHRSV
jgi:hypothetical protein